MKPKNSLSKLAADAIVRLEQLPSPVVRVCGPLTTYGDYEENLSLFKKANDALRAKGYTVFDYFEGNNDEEVIVGLGLDWQVVMEEYHKPIMATGLFDTAFFLPNWRKSSGAMFERTFLEKNTKTKIRTFPVDWLQE